MQAHVRSRHRIHLEAPAAQAFLFFTPLGEQHWVEGWRPRYIQPEDGRTRAGMVFTTGSGADFTIWLLADFDAAARRSRYVRTTPALRTGFVEIECQPLGCDDCEVTVTYELTAITPEGVASLDAFRGEAFARMIDGWGERIRGCLPALLALPL